LPRQARRRSWRRGGGPRRSRIGPPNPAWPDRLTKPCLESSKAPDFFSPQILKQRRRFCSGIRSRGSSRMTLSARHRTQQLSSVFPRQKIHSDAFSIERRARRRLSSGSLSKTRPAKSFEPDFPGKKRISLGNPLTEPFPITIMPSAEEIHSAKAHVVDRRRIVKRGH
jgi:hypothetical protein